MVDAGSELSRFFGRRSELALLRQAFDADGRKVVVLVGASGTGKSRLARQFASELNEPRLVVELAQATSLEHLVARTAAALEQTLHETRELGGALAQVGSALAERGRTLIIFDRVEQLSAPLAEALPKWAALAPQARFLLTSRARLGIAGAAEVELDGLPTPTALELFVDRARLQRADWQPSSEELGQIRELVERLGGLPLAIELCAARSSILGVGEMLSQLERKRAPLPARSDAFSRTLFEAIDESWRLLCADESAAARACAVFATSFSLDAAEAVLAELGGDGCAVVDVLVGLSNKSILRRAGQPGRLGMLEPVRAYAAEQLAGDPELERTVRDRHADYFFELGTRARLEYLESGDREALEQLASEHENLSAAFDWSVEHEAATRAAGLALSLHTLFWARGPIGLHLAMLERAVAAADDADVESRVDLLLAHSTALGHGVGRDAALAAARAAEAVAESAGHLQRKGRALARIARVHVSYGEAEPAAEIALHALEAARQSGDTLGEAYACSTIASALRQLGKLEQARSEIVQALGLLRTVKRPRLELESLELLASIERAQGRTERALAVLEDALGECKRIGDERMIANVSCELGLLHEQLAEPERARGDYERAAIALAHLGSRHEELGARLAAVAVRLELGEHESVRELCEQSLALARELGDRPAQALSAALLGVLESHAGRLGHAERAFELAAALGKDAGVDLSVAVALHRGHYQLALARRAEQDGVPKDAEQIRSSLREQLAPAPHWSDRVRQAARMLERALAATQPIRLAVSPDGSCFQLPGSAPVSLANRRTLCRLLALLAERRAEQPGVALGYGAIAEALWPGERIIASAAKSRIHVAISTLRKLGLGDFVRGGAQGYYLDPGAELHRCAIPTI